MTCLTIVHYLHPLLPSPRGTSGLDVKDADSGNGIIPYKITTYILASHVFAAVRSGEGVAASLIGDEKIAHSLANPTSTKRNHWVWVWSAPGVCAPRSRHGGKAKLVNNSGAAASDLK